MTKAELIDAVKAKLGDDVTKASIGRVLEAAGDAFLGALKKGDSFTILNLGSMKVVKRAARQGRNPRTGEAVKIPARKVVKFTTSKAVKDALN
ncbi:MAG: HU family DNA-binding protein [Deltaproteobacteria bacterium]|jgi:DNA-binding protein HU-beta|nr:HU family DNA-binding protein [Deltaproteobacteria bacterium]